MTLRTKLDAPWPKRTPERIPLSLGSRRFFLEKVFFGRRRVRRPCGLEEGLAGGAEELRLCARVARQDRGQPVLLSHGNPGGEPIGLQLRLPDGWENPSQYLVLKGVRLAYGQEAILQALATSRIASAPTKRGELVRKREGSALDLPLSGRRAREGGCLPSGRSADTFPC
ncbi:hypothetical protein MPNT_190015 [Candidatus Methylacidithermus pantelleriae]|uniref:Uncharacterized protein n=1 Tax=Candidatus Methylacidithermus pantelleriae TaxID=2744239 RepID=A0A8J2BIX0_9BACT|nr:hypothetical protein MPNT_190015 [Candidatus Methylacidithermus pantelleriae]